jgi:hypothetical protein
MIMQDGQRSKVVLFRPMTEFLDRFITKIANVWIADIYTEFIYKIRLVHGANQSTGDEPDIETQR